MTSFPGSSAVRNPPANAGDMGSMPGREDPLEKEMPTHLGYSPWGHTELDTTERLNNNN